MINVVKVDMGWGTHWALESDRIDRGKPMLISNTARTGTAREELWDDVVDGKPFKVIGIPVSESVKAEVLMRARGAIGIISYNVVKYNCEHFVMEVLTGQPRSKQVRNFFVLLATTMFAITLFR